MLKFAAYFLTCAAMSNAITRGAQAEGMQAFIVLQDIV